MGVVYLGRDDSLNRDVALKVLPEILSDSRAQAGLHRFYVEAQAIAALRHPNIIVIYELGHEGTTPFIAMEYLPGASLAEAIRDRRPYSDADKVRVIGDVCLALQHAHDRGIIHRDVKPGNIHIDDGGSVKLLDFGVAKFAEVSQTQSLYAVGTPSYLAPEVIAGHGADTRSDLFALGVTLSEWLTFEKPFAGDDVAQVMWKVVHEEATPVRQICPSVSPHLEHVIGKALAKDPAKRYQRADEMRADLARVTDVGEVTIVRPVRGEVTIVRPARIEPGAPALQPADVSRRRLIQALGLGVALLCAAAVWLASKQPPSTVVTIAPAAARPQESKVPPSLLPVERGGLQARRSARRAAAPKPDGASTPAPAAPEAPAAVTTLRIDSDVPGAQVFIDREFIGQAPVTAQNVKPGSHRINVSAPGYEGVADTIEVTPGSREITIRLKDIRLDATLDVVHKHRMGSCTGRLTATPQGIRYETTDKDDGFRAALIDMETFDVDYLKKNLRVKLRKGKQYDFTDPDGNADRLFVFHRDVAKAADRLRKSDPPAK